MTERPILFSAPMVRAILAGTKTQTRRVVKPQPPRDAIAPILENGWWMWQRFNAERRHFDGKTTEKLWDCRCPYGQPGDRLWVRETFYSDPEDGCILYRADGDFDGDQHHAGYKWQPSIHMPRWASRITLEITGCRVERLQDITWKDAEAEGCKAKWPSGVEVANFQALWESLNGPNSWAQNPWVWVVEFRRV